MPDHVGDRGAAHLDPGASRSPTYQPEECVRQAAAEPPLANLAASVFISPGRNNRPAPRQNGRFSGSSGGKRRPEPHGHKSFRPSFSTSSVSMPIIRLPRLTRDSLEGTPGGACQTAQKDASASWSRYMIVLPRRSTQEDRSRCGTGAASRFLQGAPASLPFTESPSLRIPRPRGSGRDRR